MEASSAAVLALVAKARARLRAAAILEGAAAPAAVFLLAVAAILALARAGGRTDLPAGFLAATGVLCLLAALARTARRFPGSEGAALHLDRSLGADERFVTVVETAASNPAVSAWAARGALDRAGTGRLEECLAIRPPSALVPLLLGTALVAGLLLLPAASPRAEGSGGTESALPAAAGSAGAAPGPAGGAPADPRGAAAAAAARSVARAPDAAGAAEALENLSTRAREAKSEAALRLLEEARASLSRGDRDGAALAVRRAMEAMYGIAGAAAGAVVPGATGDGAATGGPGPGGPAAAEGTPSADPGFRGGPVPLRAREAVRKYFGKGKE